MASQLVSVVASARKNAKRERREAVMAMDEKKVVKDEAGCFDKAEYVLILSLRGKG